MTEHAVSSFKNAPTTQLGRWAAGLLSTFSVMPCFSWQLVSCGRETNLPYGTIDGARLCDRLYYCHTRYYTIT